MHSTVIEVAAGVVFDPAGRILACDRPAGKHGAGKWEFPGGKIEPGENPAAALHRELDEELKLKVMILDEMYRLELELSNDRRLVIHFLRALAAEPKQLVPQEQQNFKWLKKADLFSVDWLESDLEFVNYLANKN